MALFFCRAIARAVKGKAPRKPQADIYKDSMVLCGLETMTVSKQSNFVNIGKPSHILKGSKNIIYVWCMCNKYM